MHLQEAEGERGQENQPAVQRQLQPEDVADREQKHDYIRDDVEGASHAKHQDTVSAFPLEQVLVVPVVIHVLADQHRRQRRTQSVAEDDGHDDPAPSLQGGEDLDVEEEYRDFVQASGYGPEYLQGKGDLPDALVDAGEI